MLNQHLEIWVNSCDHLGIPISGKPFITAAETFRRQRDGGDGSNGLAPDNNSCPSFSPEAFVDAIMDFIVGDDQASHIC